MNKAVQRLIRIEADVQGKPPASIHLLDVGHWHTPWHGAFEHTSADLAEMVEHFDQAVGLHIESDVKAPVNEGHDRGGKAVGWITELYLENDGTELHGKVIWTKSGAQMIAEGEYKYISPEWNPREFPWEDPEEEGRFVENVFTGAALTNIPLFKKLTPIMASADAGGSDNRNKHQGGDMNLAQLRVKKSEELTAEERTFLEEHQAELTAEERETFGFETETDEEREKREAEEQAAAEKAEAEKQAASKQGSQGTVTIDATKLASLEADAKAGREAAATLLRNELTASVEKHVKRGAIKSDELASTVDMLTASSESDRKVQLAFMDKLPDNPMLVTASARDISPSEVEISSAELQLGSDFGLSEEDIKQYKLDSAKGGN